MGYATWYCLGWIAELWAKAAIVGWIVEGGENDDEVANLLLEDLPLIARRWLVDGEFCRRMAASAAWLAEQVLQGRAGEDVARCTADEINLHLALGKSEFIFDAGASPVPELRAATSPTADDPSKWDENAKEALLRDVDAEWLWSAELDGIEDDEAFLVQFGVAPLRVSQWFEPFGDVEIGPPAVPHPADYSWWRPDGTPGR